MLIFPAIDLYQKKAVRLYQGDYSQMTVYSDDPVKTAADFVKAGAGQVHLVDLEGARDGGTPNLEVAVEIKKSAGLFMEIGGGIRNMETVERYLSAGLDRVILGTAAVTDEAFLSRAVREYRERIAVSADVRDGKIALRGWTELSGTDLRTFFGRISKIGVRTAVVTDISRDGAMRGTNRELYRELSADGRVQIVASGGVSSIEDVRALRAMGLYGAIIGKAYYTGAVDLSEAVREAE